ncbi:MAG TPA: DUF4166 domain-containing protein [Burkholderiales bacterium]
MTANTTVLVSTSVTPASLYARALGPLFHRLAPVLTRLHGTGERRLHGTLKVRVGARPHVRLMMSIARMPRSSEAVESEVALGAHRNGELWWRRVGDLEMVSVQLPGGDKEIIERIGPLAIHLFTEVRKGNLWQRSRYTTLFGIPLPATLGMQIVACERAIDAKSFFFDVRLRTPLLGCLLQYRGTLRFEN